MRCNNCGWENPANSRRCEKCNAPLKGSMVQHNEQIPDTPDDKPIAGTVKGDSANTPFLDKPEVEKRKKNQQLDKNQLECKECGYPVNKNAKKCPSCGKPIEKSSKRNINQEQKKKVSGTVSPWEKPKYSQCFLKPIAREGEKEFLEIQLSGDEVELNRNNLEKNNMTITSKVQALLQNFDGKWYIVNKSSLQTTFKFISEPIELKKGDIILMGDRKFEFDV